MYVQSGTHKYVHRRVIAFQTQDPTVLMFEDINKVPKLEQKYAETWVFVAVSGLWPLREIIQVLTYWKLLTANILSRTQRINLWQRTENLICWKWLWHSLILIPSGFTTDSLMTFTWYTLHTDIRYFLQLQDGCKVLIVIKVAIDNNLQHSTFDRLMLTW